MVRMDNLGESNDGLEDLFVFRPGLFFLDELIDQLGDGAAGNASGRLGPRVITYRIVRGSSVCSPVASFMTSSLPMSSRRNWSLAFSSSMP